jgi:predicted secreted protein
MDARCHGSCEAYVRLDIYKFDDTNPTEDPRSELLRREEIPLDVNSSSWKNYEISFDPEELTGSQEANMVMFYLMLAPPEQGESSLEVDELQVIEWRSASQMPDIYGAFTHVRSNGETRTISYQALTAQPR